MTIPPRNRNWTEFTALGFSIAFPSALTAVYFVLLQDQEPAWQQATYGVGKLIQFSFPVLWIAGVLRQPVLIRRPNSDGLWLGFLFGLLVLVAMLLVYRWMLKPSDLFSSLELQIRTKVQGLGLDRAWKYAAVAIFYAACHSLLEEYYWRWFVFGQLQSHLPIWPSIFVSALGFMSHHIILVGFFFQWQPLPTCLFSLSVAVGGIFWAWLYQRTQLLYAPWLSHLLVDSGIFLIGYDVVRDLL